MLTPIRGLAVPYNKINSHDEIIRPGTFTEFLTPTLRLPMKIMHDYQIGWWDRFVDTQDALYVEGYADNSFDIDKFNELSITYNSGLPADGVKKMSAKRWEEFPPWIQKKINGCSIFSSNPRICDC